MQVIIELTWSYFYPLNVNEVSKAENDGSY